MLGLFRRPQTMYDETVPRLEPLEPGLWSRGFGLAATRSLQTLAVLALVAVGVLVITQLSLVFIPVTIALILASAIHPLVAVMRRRGVPSILATWIALIGILAILGGIVWVIVLTVRSQWDDLITSATDGITQITAWLDTLPFDIVAIDLDDVWAGVGDFLTSASFGRGALAGVSATASFFTGLALMIVVAYAVLTTCWKPIDKAVGWFWTPMGENSLYVFVVHVFFVIAVGSIPGLDRGDFWIGTAVHTVVVLLIWAMVKRRVLFSVIPR